MRNCSCCDPYDNQSAYCGTVRIAERISSSQNRMANYNEGMSFFHIRLHLNQVGMTMMPQ